MDKIQERFAETALRRRNMWLYFIRDAIDVISECQKQGITLRGLDAFLISGKGIQPSMSNSLWFEEKSPENYARAKEFLSLSENEPYVYEVWYG